MSRTTHLISTGNLACELGISVRALGQALDQLGCRPSLVLNDVPYFPRSAAAKIARAIDRAPKRSPKAKSAGI